MSLFNKIKSVFNSSSDDVPDAQTIYFKNGEMYKVYPTDKESWYDARYLVSDGVKYDLESSKDLNRIPIPTFTNIDIMHGYGITGSLEYVLRMKAGNLRRKGLLEESDSILERIHLFMGAADNGYQEKDFLIYSHLLLKEGHFEESAKYKAIVQSYLKTLRVCHNSFSFYNRAKDVMDKLLSDCRKYNTDYISMSAHLACCEECNKLQGRVYSISGKSKIFPKLPDVIRETGKVHNGCAHSFSVFFYTGKNDTIFDKNGNDVNAIKSSQRPFKDDRTAEEKKNYLKNYNKEKNKIEFLNIFAEEYKISSTDNKFYFFNPFSVQLFMKVINNILISLEKSPRDIDLILYYPSDEYIYYLENYTGFLLYKEIELPNLSINDKRQKFSIYRLTV